MLRRASASRRSRSWSRVAATGWLYLVAPARSRAADRRGAAARRAVATRRGAARLVRRRVGRRRPCCSALVRALGARRAAHRSARARPRRRRLASTCETGVSIAVVRQVSVRDGARRGRRGCRPSTSRGARRASRRAARRSPRGAPGARRSSSPRSSPWRGARPAPRDAARRATRAPRGAHAGRRRPARAGRRRACAAVALLVAARGLARGAIARGRSRRRVAALSTSLHVLHGFNQGTLVSAIVLVAARRAAARLRPAAATRPSDASCSHARRRRARRDRGTGSSRSGSTASRPTSRLDSLRAARDAAALLGLHLRRLAAPRRRRSADWFPLSLFLIAAAALALVSPGGSHRGATGVPGGARASARARARRAWGADTLAPFVLRADKSYFFTRTRRRSSPTASSAASRSSPATRSARASGCGELVGSFVEFAHDRDWRVAILGASEGGSRSTPRTACTRSTTATRRSSTRRRSRSTAGRSARCGSRCTGSCKAGYTRRVAAPERDRRRPAQRARSGRARRGAATRPSAGS